MIDKHEMSGGGKEIPNFLLHRASLSPNQIAIDTVENRLTFKQLDQTVRKWAAYLQNHGVKSEMHIGVCMPNSLLLIEIIFALQYIGAVTVFLNTRLTAKEKEMQLIDGDVDFLLVTEEADSFGEASVAALHLSSGAADDYSVTTLSIKEVFFADELATIMFTSGTTGRAKGVMQTHGNHLYSALNSVLNMGLTSEDKWLLQLPMYHVSGYSTLIKSMVYGMTVVLPQERGLKGVLATIKNESVTLVSMVAKNLQDIFALDKVESLSEVRGILLGGGPVQPQLLEHCAQYHLPIYLSYGMTETASQVATLGGAEVYQKLGSVGKPLFFNQIRIEKIEETDEVGEILIKGPTVMKGYYHLPEETANRITADGYFRTGDLGYLDDEGFLYIASRRSDLIISGGENIYPAEIEMKLMEMNEFTEVAVVGKKHEDWGEVPVAFYVMQEGKRDMTATEIATYLQGCLAKYKIPIEFYCIDQLPRNALGKIQRTILQEKLGSN